MRELKTAAIAVVTFSVVLGLAFPLFMTGLGQVVFPGKADGSMVEHDGKLVGSTLIGQSFAKHPEYFQSRPSATGYSPSATFFNNQGPNQRVLADQLKGYVRTYLRREGPYTPGLTAAKIPADAATTSASGVDPQISLANARIQAARVAKLRGLPIDRVRALIDENTDGRFVGVLGDPGVNVLELNLALDAETRR